MPTQLKPVIFAHKPIEDYGRIISVESHLSHFTLDEQAAIDLMSIDNSNATNEVRLQQAKIRQVLKQLDRTTEVNLDDAKFQEATLSACALLVTAGLITDAQEKYNAVIYPEIGWADLPERLKSAYLR